MGSGDAQVHRERRTAIQEEFPEVRKLVGHDPRTQYFAYGLVIFQVLLAYLVRDSFVGAVVMGVTVSPYADFAVLTLIHEVSHNLVFASILYNRLLGIFSNIVLLAPVAESFRQYHNMHHLHLGSTKKDVDVPTERETEVVGNSPLRKILWLVFSFFILPIRSLRKMPIRWSPLMFFNWVFCLSFTVCVFLLSQPSFVYLLLGMLLSQSMHPANARQVQRHIKVHTKEKREQEEVRKDCLVHQRKLNTFSYYGPQNYFTLNVGYHVEHHDFGNIPWTRLPALHKIAGTKWYPRSAAYETRGIAEIVAFVTNPLITLADYAGRNN